MSDHKTILFALPDDPLSELRQDEATRVSAVEGLVQVLRPEEASYALTDDGIWLRFSGGESSHLPANQVEDDLLTYWTETTGVDMDDVDLTHRVMIVEPDTQPNTGWSPVSLGFVSER